MKLGIDTSTENLSIALFDGKKVIGSWDLMTKMQHGASLVWEINHLLSQYGISQDEIRGVISGRGPGSYTGLRVGVTACKIWAVSQNIPLYQVSSLALMAALVPDTKAIIIPLMDARRMSCYVGAYQWQKDRVEPLWEDQHADWGEWLNQYGGYFESVTLIGKDLDKFVQVFKETLPQVHVEVRDGIGFLPQIKMAYHTPIQEVASPDLFTPFYGQATLAEREWIEKKGNGAEEHEAKWVEITNNIFLDPIKD